MPSRRLIVGRILEGELPSLSRWFRASIDTDIVGYNYGYANAF